MQKLGDDVYSVKMTKIKLKEIYGDIELFALHFDIYFFYKNLLITVLHHGNIILYFEICVKLTLFNNNLNEEEMITSHLMCVKPGANRSNMSYKMLYEIT